MRNVDARTSTVMLPNQAGHSLDGRAIVKQTRQAFFAQMMVKIVWVTKSQGGPKTALAEFRTQDLRISLSRSADAEIGT